MKKWKVVVVDDHKLLRHGLIRLLKDYPDFEVVGQADDGMEAVKICERTKPDVVVMDVSMPTLNGIEAATQIKSNDPDIKIIVCSVHDDRNVVAQVLNMGISGYVLKTAAADDLIEALYVVTKNKTYLSPDISSIALNLIQSPREVSSREQSMNLLTRKERHILQLVAEGKSSKEIANILGISFHTVKTHRYNIMEKLELHSVADLTRFAIANKLTGN